MDSLIPSSFALSAFLGGHFKTTKLIKSHFFSRNMTKGLSLCRGPSVVFISFKPSPAQPIADLLKNPLRTECPHPGSAQNGRAPF